MKIRGPDKLGVPLADLNVAPGDVVHRMWAPCPGAEYYMRTEHGWLRLRDAFSLVGTPSCDRDPVWRKAGVFVEQSE